MIIIIELERTLRAHHIQISYFTTDQKQSCRYEVRRTPCLTAVSLNQRVYG